MFSLSEQKHSRSTDQEQAQLNKSILDSSFEAIVVANDDGKIIKVNDSMLSIFGYESSEHVEGQDLSILVGGREGHAENHSSSMKKFWERGGQSTILGETRNLVAKHLDGTEFPCRIGIRKVRDSNLLVGFIHNISHERWLEREQHGNQSILDSSFEAIVVADDEGKISKVNAAMLEIFGYDRSDDVVGQNLSMLVGGQEGYAENHSTYMKKFWERGGQSTILVRATVCSKVTLFC
ncbi:hypothetical protein ACA910_001674 [Epithemia clementina (nom. ined.)]